MKNEASIEEPVTIVDVASRAGVSISSVSAALNDRPGVSEQTRERIRAIANDLGFVPSLRGKSLSAKRAFALGVVVQRDAALLETDPFFAGFIAGVESVLADRGYALVLQVEPENADVLQRYRTLAAGRRVDGLFLLDIKVDDPRVDLLLRLRLPVVGINADAKGFPFLSVRQDHEPGIESLVNYLIGVGHTNIAHASGPSQFIHARHRRSAWEAALRRAGIEPGPVIEGDFTYESGRRIAEGLIGMANRPTAVVCANDLAAIGLMQRLEELGLSIPADISVAGYDGIQLGSYVRPTLTTLTTNPREIGAAAARVLLDLVDGNEATDVEVPPARMLLRESTGPAPTQRQSRPGRGSARRLR